MDHPFSEEVRQNLGRNHKQSFFLRQNRVEDQMIVHQGEYSYRENYSEFLNALVKAKAQAE